MPEWPNGLALSASSFLLTGVRILLPTYASVAQLIERLIRNQKVVGLIPARGFYLEIFCFNFSLCSFWQDEQMWIFFEVSPEPILIIVPFGLSRNVVLISSLQRWHFCVIYTT